MRAEDAEQSGSEKHCALDDVRYLLGHLNVATAQEAIEIVTRYFDEEQLPAKSRLAFEELLSG